ncbi:cytochrome P450 [Aspergillus pseudodeflectus]|uniref:Cytochrome P450 n=1 Tax=Aspergillus pseudodeflectus TaxID=176178 RepID=A0ABR4JVH2_9EURO
MSFLVIIALGVFTALFIQHKKSPKQSIDNEYKGPPLINAWDCLGIIRLVEIIRHFQRKDIRQYTDRLFKTYGHTYAVNLLGKQIILTHNAHNITQVLSTGFADYSPADNVGSLFSHATPHGIFATKNSNEWKKTRKALQMALANNRGICDLNILEEHVEKFLKSVPPDRAPFDIQAKFADLCTDIMATFALGASTDQLGSTQTAPNKLFVENLNYIKSIIAKCGLLGPLHHLIPKRRFRIACDDARNYVTGHVNEQLQSPGSVSHGNEGNRTMPPSLFLRGFDRDTRDASELSSHSLSIILAAIDSMATVLSATFFLLAQDERVTAKLQATILENIGYGHPTYEQLQSMEYLRFVLSEAMRLFPAVTFSGRIANKDTLLPYGGGSNGMSNVQVRKGTVVVISNWASHRMSDIFSDRPAEFYPERWEGLQRDPPGYLPFLQGPKACPGRRYAMTQISYIVTRILQTVSDIEDYNCGEWKEKFGFGFENANGVIVGLHRDFPIKG